MDKNISNSNFGMDKKIPYNNNMLRRFFCKNPFSFRDGCDKIFFGCFVRQWVGRATKDGLGSALGFTPWSFHKEASKV